MVQNLLRKRFHKFIYSKNNIYIYLSINRSIYIYIRISSPRYSYMLIEEDIVIIEVGKFSFLFLLENSSLINYKKYEVIHFSKNIFQVKKEIKEGFKEGYENRVICVYIYIFKHLAFLFYVFYFFIFSSKVSNKAIFSKKHRSLLYITTKIYNLF